MARSRGLGDVYKRQILGSIITEITSLAMQLTAKKIISFIII
jgi:hypothetical protein